MPSKIDIFDFDGTLFRNPLDTPQNRAKYEKKTGIPWIISKEKSRELSRKRGKFIGMRKGWYGRKETLSPPLVPDPATKDFFIQSTCDAFLKSKADENVQTVLMTGRHGGIKSQVLRICGDGKLVDVKRKGVKNGKLFVEQLDKNVMCFFMGDNGPDPEGKKPNETLPWKIWIIEQFVRLYPDLETIEIWEDREPHVDSFRELDELLDQKVIVNHVV